MTPFEKAKKQALEARRNAEPCKRGQRCDWLKSDGHKGVCTAGACIQKHGWAADTLRK